MPDWRPGRERRGGPVACEGEPRRKILTVTRPGGRARPAVAAALAELERVVPAMLACERSCGGGLPLARPAAGQFAPRRGAPSTPNHVSAAGGLSCPARAGAAAAR
ncbi:hypothetical protein GCM10017786_05500 [Amycolatopsis deserti]|uniref:Uncharacterized protein n=1 Tax=Amycolatopsis deserti TaxID=185696 RepID=A0ABQ3IF02_9PSEU|nr:hypothetical protein GCM10017786_05500 [Amycolatopsis deserti]